MKAIYIRPTIEQVTVNVESFLAGTGTEKGKYDIGSDSSQWPKTGDIHDDHGAGPGVSGAKKIFLRVLGRIKFV